MNIQVKAFMRTYVLNSIETKPSGGIAGLLLWGRDKLFLKKQYHSPSPPAMDEGSEFSIFSAALVIACLFFFLGILKNVKCNLFRCGFDLHFPITNEAQF